MGGRELEINYKKLQEPPTVETSLTDHCACRMPLACTQILLLLIEKRELAFGKGELAVG